MNAFQNYFNPMSAFQQGADFINQADEAAWRNQERKRMLAQRQALSDFGQGGYLMGFEGVPGAERSSDLQGLWRHDPEMALQAEQRMSAPFAMDREITKAGKLESAKRNADAEVDKNMMAEYFKLRGGGLGPMQASSSPVPAGGGAPAQPDYASLSGDELSFEMTPQGFKFGVKGMSDIDRATKANDIHIKQEELGLKKEDQILNKARFNEELGKNEQESLNKLHQQSVAVTQQLRELERAKNTGEMTPQAFLEQANELMQQKKQIHAQKDVILRGQSQSRDIADMKPAEYRNEQSTVVQPVTPKTSGQLEPSKPTAPMLQPKQKPMAQAASPEVGSGLPYKLQQEVKQQNAKEKISIANKAIEDAHAGAMKAESLNDAMARMTGLVNKGVGSTAMGALPWGIGESIMAIGHDNKRVQSLNAQLIEMYKTEGQTKAFDTLPELKIVASRIPGLDKSEDQNREDMAGVANLMDARRASGDFLEQWAKSHGGTLDGSREVLRGWMQHSPLYQVQTNNGRVSIEQNPHYIPLETWTRLRQQFSDRDIVKMRDSNKLQIIGGKVFVDK